MVFVSLVVGEGRFLTLQKKDIRASRDWMENKWIDLKPMPDILVFLSENVTPRLKPAGNVGQGLSDLAESVDLLENVKNSSSSKRAPIYNEDETNNSIGCDSDSEHLDANASSEKKSVSEEDEPYEKCEAPEALKVTT